MKEYITKDRAKQFVCGHCNEVCSEEPCESSDCDWMAFIDKEPAADVAEVRHGRWTIAEDDYYGLNIVKCSVCHEEWCFEERDDVFDLNYHYCPNCGAKMDKEATDDKKQPEETPGE